MGDFGLDYSHLCAVVAPDRIPMRGNEHRITRVAFDLFRLDEDKENLWQVQADDDGNEFLVRTYELPKDDAIQTTSEWRVMEDGRRASLTVAYKGMPVHRLVAAEYGAHTPDEVKLLRDLVQAKLAEPEFAGRMLASMPEPKRAALLATFPKLAANVPLIPPSGGKDPLEGIEPMDPREYSPVVKRDQPLPPPGDWEKHPQNAEDRAKETFCQMLVRVNAWNTMSELIRHFVAAAADPVSQKSIKYMESQGISAKSFQQVVRQFSSACTSKNDLGAIQTFSNMIWMAKALMPSLQKYKGYRAAKSALDMLGGIEEEWEQTPQRQPPKGQSLPQNAEDKGEDPWADRDFEFDMGRPALQKEAKTIVPKVMAYLKAQPGKKVSLQTLYTELEVNDIPLYMALHALVKGGFVNGPSPYDEPSPEMAALTGQPETSHRDLFYSVGESVQNADEE